MTGATVNWDDLEWGLNANAVFGVLCGHRNRKDVLKLAGVPPSNFYRHLTTGKVQVRELRRLARAFAVRMDIFNVQVEVIRRKGIEPWLTGEEPLITWISPNPPVAGLPCARGHLQKSLLTADGSVPTRPLGVAV